MLRKIVRIDQEKCDGCGLCAQACAEGAIEIVNGKARLVSESYCDGLGACLGECPRDAIVIEERQAAAFDPEAATARAHGHFRPEERLSAACPGSMARQIEPRLAKAGPVAQASSASELSHWPVQLRLVPPEAPFLRGADLLVVADCVPFALADFHNRYLRGRALVVGCPKLDDAAYYVMKLAEILRNSAVRSVTVVHMEVPCCFGLRRIVEMAMEQAGVAAPLTTVKIGINGQVLETTGPAEAAQRV